MKLSAVCPFLARSAVSQCRLRSLTGNPRGLRWQHHWCHCRSGVRRWRRGPGARLVEGTWSRVYVSMRLEEDDLGIMKRQRYGGGVWKIIKWTVRCEDDCSMDEW